jgi:glycosyltransferase involved in cell wall biosynthesis
MTQSFDFSVVSAVYNVARYLPEYIASLEAQRGIDLSRIEVVAVNDGSTDDSLALLEQWRDRSRLSVSVVSKENGGQGSARNLGMETARGAWVTFLDPDDTVEKDYFARVLRFVQKHPTTEMVGTARWMHDEAKGTLTDTHPLRFMFTRDQLLDLDGAPHYFHGSAPAAFFRRERLLESGVRFDDRIRPNFEDGHFCTRYLLECPKPLVGFVASAQYNYRKRADASSTLNSSLAQPGRYTEVPRRGYLDVLQRSADAHGGRAQAWLQNFVLYELSWYFSGEAAMSGSQTACRGDIAKQFLVNLRDVMRLIDPGTVEEFAARNLESVWRDILLHGLAGETWHAPYAVVGPTDRGQHLFRVITRFTGPEPETEYLCDGAVVQPVHTKVRSHVYFDHDLCQERISWVPLGETMHVRLDGQVVEMRRKWPRPAPITVVLEGEPRKHGRWERRVRNPRRALRSLRRRTVRRAALSWPLNRSFRDAWVLMDRIHDADDSGEHLFHYLRENRPDVNAWFVVEKGTPDWKRLKPQLGSRLVAHGTWRWTVLMLNCDHMISSHVDKPVHRPPQVTDLLPGNRPTWRFSFLQHGVIKDDLSRWLNPKAVHLFVTSTAAEYESVAGDRTQYAYTSRETQLTGLPRFDRLLAAAQRVTPEQRDLLLVTPTWRQWLTPPLEKGSQRRVLHEDFLHTEYAEQWLGFLRSERVAKVCEEHGLRVGFLPHPNLQSVTSMLELPPHVVTLSFTDNNVQELFARAAVLVTDYSSMAFNAAYLDRPVVYFQFDAEAVQSGAHVGRAGYFDYERDGFGPVVEDVPGAVAAVEGIAAAGFEPDPLYLERNRETFVLRDGRCCERVTAAIEQLNTPWDEQRRPVA